MLLMFKAALNPSVSQQFQTFYLFCPSFIGLRKLEAFFGLLITIMAVTFGYEVNLHIYSSNTVPSLTFPHPLLNLIFEGEQRHFRRVSSRAYIQHLVLMKAHEHKCLICRSIFWYYFWIRGSCLLPELITNGTPNAPWICPVNPFILSPHRATV